VEKRQHDRDGTGQFHDWSAAAGLFDTMFPVYKNVLGQSTGDNSPNFNWFSFLSENSSDSRR
jgi:hypothetical protein